MTLFSLSFPLSIALSLVISNSILIPQTVAAVDLEFSIPSQQEFVAPHVSPRRMSGENYVLYKLDEWEEHRGSSRKRFWNSDRKNQQNRIEKLTGKLEEVTQKLLEQTLVLDTYTFSTQDIWRALFNTLLKTVRTEMQIAFQGMRMPQEACGCSEFERASLNAFHGYKAIQKALCASKKCMTSQGEKIFNEANNHIKHLNAFFETAKIIEPFLDLSLLLPQDPSSSSVPTRAEHLAETEALPVATSSPTLPAHAGQQTEELSSLPHTYWTMSYKNSIWGDWWGDSE